MGYKDRRSGAKKSPEPLVESSTPITQALRHSRSVAAIATDASGSTLWCSQGFTSLSGYEEAELIGRKPEKVLPSPNGDPLATEVLERHLAAHESVSMEMLNRRKDGTEYWGRVEVTPCHSIEGAVVGHLWLLHDGSADQARQHQQNDVFKDRLLSAFSHEVRTPLNALCNLVDLMANSPDREAQLIEWASQSTKALRSLVDNVLDMARISTRGVEPRPAPGSVAALLKSLSAILSAYPRKPGVTLSVEADPDIPEVCFDEHLLLRTLLNLSSNALKFTDQGQVDVRVTRGRQVADPHRELLVFSVSDTGDGISPQDQARLFRPFEQVGKHQPGLQRGSGLGLALCSEMVRAMGSQIQVRSAVGAGSCFSFELLLSRSESMPVPDGPAAPGIEGMRVLVVDDNPLGLAVAQRQLTRLGAVVCTATSGHEALEMLRVNERPDAVLMDLQMPDLDGYQATRLLRELPGCLQLPVLALSAAGSQEDRKRAENASMSAFVTKPFRTDDLALALLGCTRRPPRI